MAPDRSLRIGITCYPSVGGSGILASALGEELARRGHEVHFISYERPFRLPVDAPRLHFHPVGINAYGLFKYPDYTLPLSVKMAEVSRDHRLDVLHVHYAVPHATAAILARSMLPPEQQPAGGHDAARHRHHPAGPRRRLRAGDPPRARPVRMPSPPCRPTFSTRPRNCSASTRPIDVIHNFFAPRRPRRSREEVRRELGVGDEVMVLHCSNLRPVKRIDLLLETAARIRPRDSFKLVILAGEDFAPFANDVLPARPRGPGDRGRAGS